MFRIPAYAGNPDLFSLDWIKAKKIPKVFEVEVIGRSMEPTVREGAILTVRFCPRPRIGQIVVASTPWGVAVKRLALAPTGDSVLLRSDNPGYREILWPAAEVVFLGVWEGK